MDDRYLVELKFGDGSFGYFVVTVDQYGSLIDDFPNDLCITWEDVERWVLFSEIKGLVE